MQQNIKVGVDDWLSFATAGQFYPDDMPVEWRLSYYANEFETACVHLDGKFFGYCEDLSWLQDLPAGFELYFLDPAASDMDSTESEIVLQPNHAKSVILDAALNTTVHFITAADVWAPPASTQAGPFARLPGDADLAQYRQWIELWVAQSGQQQRLLWLDGRNTSPAKLTEIRMLVELMGF